MKNLYLALASTGGVIGAWAAAFLLGLAACFDLSSPFSVAGAIAWSLPLTITWAVRGFPEY